MTEAKAAPDILSGRSWGDVTTRSQAAVIADEQAMIRRHLARLNRDMLPLSHIAALAQAMDRELFEEAG